MGETYGNAGVNLELGDDASKILYNASRLTWPNRKGRIGEVVERFSDFSGLRAIHVGSLPNGTYMSIGFDGIGTKTEVHERLARHDKAAFDLFAMVCDDAVVRGAEPVLLGSILDVRSLGEKNESYIDFVRQLAAGYIDAAKAARVAVINGEVAELGARVHGHGPFNYNWGAGVVWFANGARLFSGREIKEGDSLVGLREHGFRSNGLSLVRRIMEKTYGKEWHYETLKRENLGELIAHPSTIYTAAVVDMFGGFESEPRAEIHGVAHITGGGVPGKLGRVLKPSGLGAVISELFEPCEAMLYCQEKGGVAPEEAYRAWNMGQGMIVITPEPEKTIAVAGEHGIEAKVVGEITKNPGIVIKNRSAIREPNELVFPAQ